MPSFVPKNATVWLSVLAMVIEEMNVSGKCKIAWPVIGETPEIFSPTSQKLRMFPVVCKESETTIDIKNDKLCDTYPFNYSFTYTGGRTLSVLYRTADVTHISILDATVETHVNIFVELGFDVLQTVYTNCRT